MLLGGVSVQGKYHKENQDSFRCAALDRGFAAALSDGLGSLRDSKAGSEAACVSVLEVARGLGNRLAGIDPREFVRLVHARWLKLLDGHDIGQCCATLLLFVCYGEHAFAARLGDGFIGSWTDGTIDVLFDAKEDRFVNETDCLTEKLAAERVFVFEKDVKEVYGGVMCSDGIEFGEMTLNELTRFTRAFVEGYQGMYRKDILDHIADWLRDWPGLDDKTLAFFIAGEEQNNEEAV